MFEYILLNSPDLILSNICSVINPTEKCRNTVILWCMGVAKTKKIVVFYQIIHSRFIHTPTQKFNPFLILKISNKIKQTPKSAPSNPLSYSISSKPTKIKHFTHFTTKKSNHHPAKNSPTNPKSSLFISTFTDNDFSSKNRSKHTLATLPTGGT